MIIKSPAFQNNQKIPAKYTCDGEGGNPPLNFLDIPKQARSLALIVDDPDAPRATFVHWTVWNIPPRTTEIPEGTVPSGVVEGKTSTGESGYVGPCPPSGTHRYFFKIYALDDVLDLSSGAAAEDLQHCMEGRILEKAQLIGLYAKKS